MNQSNTCNLVTLTFTIPWANSANNKLMILFFFFFSFFLFHKRGFEISCILSPKEGDNLHEMSKQFFWKKYENISKCHPMKILPSMLSVHYEHLRINIKLWVFWCQLQDFNKVSHSESFSQLQS